MNKTKIYSKKQIGVCQQIGGKAWAALTRGIQQLTDQREVFERAGLKDAVKKAQEKINLLQIKRKQLEEELEEERRAMSKYMLYALVGCDLLTVMAEEFGKAMHDYSHGYYAEHNELEMEIKEQAKALNKIVLSVDAIGNEAMSNFYADMSEDVIAAVKPKIYEIVQDYMESEKGRRYF